MLTVQFREYLQTESTVVVAQLLWNSQSSVMSAWASGSDQNQPENQKCSALPLSTKWRSKKTGDHWVAARLAMQVSGSLSDTLSNHLVSSHWSCFSRTSHESASPGNQNPFLICFSSLKAVSLISILLVRMDIEVVRSYSIVFWILRM